MGRYASPAKEAVDTMSCPEPSRFIVAMIQISASSSPAHRSRASARCTTHSGPDQGNQGLPC